MAKLLVRSIVLLMALSYSCAGTCEDEEVEFLQDLVEIHRGVGETLQEIARTQNHKKTAQCQTLKETQKNLTRDLNKLLGEFDYDMDELKEPQGVDTEDQPSSPVCRAPFEPVGRDCVHLGEEKLIWTKARDYCHDMGGNLFVPSDKKGFDPTKGYQSMTGSHPPLFDFLNVLKEKMATNVIGGWIGASISGGDSITWLSESEELSGECSFAVVNKEIYAFSEYYCGNSVYPLCSRQ